MKSLYRLSTVGFVFCVVAVTLLASMATSGQGRFAARYSKRDVGNIISRLEQSSDTFRRDFDRQMDRSNINNSQSEDRFNNIVEDFENSVDRLRRQFDSGDSWWESRNNVEGMIRDSRPVNTMMTTLPFRRNLERQWANLRSNINTLADTYDLPGLNGGGWNGGGGGGGGGVGGNVPNWAVGTFYARNPQNGGKITLVVSRNGSVSLSYDDGTPTYASMNGTLLTNGPYTSRVSRINRGIRTTSTTNNDFIDYLNTWDGGGWGGGGGSSGGNVPNWAVGTFYARNPQNGGKITIVVSRNGSVSLSYDDGPPTYASMNGTLLTNGPYTSRVSRLNRGIRTTSTTNNDYIDYLNTWDGGVGGGGGGGVGGNVPSWALGTFYARNPQTGGRIAMSIERNGTVVLTYDGTNTTYATLNGTLLTNGPYTSRVSRIRNGIRTTSTTNNDVIEYYRNQ